MVKLLGVPFHFGQKEVGVSRTPEFLRELGLKDMLSTFEGFEDYGDLDFDHLKNEPFRVSLACQIMSTFITSRYKADDFLANIGGDHGLSLGTIHGILTCDPERVVIWVDAHGDMNTSLSSTSGNFHGMPLSYLLNLNADKKFEWIKQFLKPEKLILIGPRDLDQFEKDIIKELSIQCYSSEQINDLGMDTILKQALAIADPDKKHKIHLSLDVDVFNCEDMKATGLSLSDGPKADEIFFLCRTLKETGRLKSMDLVEFNLDLANQEGLINSVETVFKIFINVI